MKSFISGVLWLCLFLRYTSLATAGDAIVSPRILSTPIKFGKDTFYVKFPAEYEAAEAMAMKFCDEKVTSDDIDMEEACYKPIGALLRSRVEQELNKAREHDLQRQASLATSDSLAVTLEIGGKKFVISVNRRETDGPFNSASKFCAENLGAFGLTPDRLESCIAPVHQHLQSVVASAPALTSTSANPQSSTPSPPTGGSSIIPNKKDDKILVSFTVNEKTFTLPFASSLNSPSIAAKEFCVRNRGETGVLFSKIKELCVAPVESAIREAVQRHSAAASSSSVPQIEGGSVFIGEDESVDSRNLIPLTPKSSKSEAILQVKLNIQEETYTIEVEANVGDASGSSPKSPSQSADSFCRSHRDIWRADAGGLLDNCVAPVREYLQRAVDDYIAGSRETAD